MWTGGEGQSLNLKSSLGHSTRVGSHHFSPPAALGTAGGFFFFSCACCCSAACMRQTLSHDYALGAQLNMDYIMGLILYNGQHGQPCSSSRPVFTLTTQLR